MNENQFREQIIKDLEKKGIACVNLHGEIFDLYIPIFKKFIVCKKITSFEHTPKMTDESGIKFTDNETDALRKLSELQDYKEYKELPIIAIMDDMTNKGSYYLIPDVLKGYTIERKQRYCCKDCDRTFIPSTKLVKPNTYLTQVKLGVWSICSYLSHPSTFLDPCVIKM